MAFKGFGETHSFKIARGIRGDQRDTIVVAAWRGTRIGSFANG